MNATHEVARLLYCEGLPTSFNASSLTDSCIACLWPGVLRANSCVWAYVMAMFQNRCVYSMRYAPWWRITDRLDCKNKPSFVQLSWEGRFLTSELLAAWDTVNEAMKRKGGSIWPA